LGHGFFISWKRIGWAGFRILIGRGEGIKGRVELLRGIWLSLASRTIEH
jgi:hypothetical protein